MKHRQMNILTGRETTHRERSTNILTSIRQPQRHDSDRLDTKGANINRQEQRPINKKTQETDHKSYYHYTFKEIHKLHCHGYS